MKSKAYILREIRELLIDNRGYSEDDAKEKADELAPRTVYELLTLKKELATGSSGAVRVSSIPPFAMDNDVLCTQCLHSPELARHPTWVHLPPDKKWMYPLLADKCFVADTYQTSSNR